jgi:hypothetical protein
MVSLEITALIDNIIPLIGKMQEKNAIKKRIDILPIRG